MVFVDERNGKQNLVIYFFVIFQIDNASDKMHPIFLCRKSHLIKRIKIKKIKIKKPYLTSLTM